MRGGRRTSERDGLERHRQDWERLAEVDATWAVLTEPRLKGGGWHAEAFFATGEAEIDHVLAVAASHGRPLAFRRALDFGCGVGRLTRALGRRFERVVGVDISQRMVAQARRMNDAFPGCEFRVNATPDLAQFDTGTFDFDYSSLVLQHLPSRGHVESYVRELLRVAAPAGLVVFGVPSLIAFPWSLQPRRRLYAVLRRLGASEAWLLRRTPLTPMRMTAVPQAAVLNLVAREGAGLLHVEEAGDRRLRTKTYYVAPADG